MSFNHLGCLDTGRISFPRSSTIQVACRIRQLLKPFGCQGGAASAPCLDVAHSENRKSIGHLWEIYRISHDFPMFLDTVEHHLT